MFDPDLFSRNPQELDGFLDALADSPRFDLDGAHAFPAGAASPLSMNHCWAMVRRLFTSQ
jgi:hypothetical protein